jgi:hypothetical protein
MHAHLNAPRTPIREGVFDTVRLQYTENFSTNDCGIYIDIHFVHTRRVSHLFFLLPIWLPSIVSAAIALM